MLSESLDLWSDPPLWELPESIDSGEASLVVLDITLLLLRVSTLVPKQRSAIEQASGYGSLSSVLDAKMC
jgi:hypothetical protein